MAGPLGITFLPSADQADQGLRQGGREGDLSQVFRLLSLNLRRPKVFGARAISPDALLNAPGAAGLTGGPGGGMNPYAAVFEALLRAGGFGGDLGGEMGGSGAPPVRAGAPRITPGLAPPSPPGSPDEDVLYDPGVGLTPWPTAPPDRSQPSLGDRPPGDVLRRGPWRGYDDGSY